MTTPGAFTATVDGFAVDPGELTARATAADGRAERIRRAASGPPPLDPGSYGVVGRLFAGSATTSIALAGTALAELAANVAGTADALRGCRDGYLQTEDLLTAHFTGIGR